MKKTLSLLLAVLVLASFSVTAFAGPSQEADFAPEFVEEAAEQTVDKVTVIDEATGEEVEITDAEVEVSAVSLEDIDASEEVTEEVKAAVKEAVVAANDTAKVESAAKAVLAAVTDQKTEDDLKARVAEKLGVAADTVDSDVIAANVTISKVYVPVAKVAESGAAVVTGTLKQVIPMTEAERASFVAPVVFNAETGEWEPVAYEFDADGNLVFEVEANAIVGFLTLVEAE